MLWAVCEETPQGWPLLDTTKSVDGETHGEGDKQVDAKADDSHTGTKEPEAFTEALAFCRLDAIGCPDWPGEVLQGQEEQWDSDICPIGEDCRGNQGTKAT